jgi:hypothetical protein
MNTKTATSKSAPTTQEICIDLPGESVQCWRSADHVRVILRKHRDVFFDINIQDGATYTVESTSDYYSPREKKLQRKSQFQDGERFQLWVGRNFRGSLVLKSGNAVMGSFEPNELDTKDYGSHPKTKPEPLMVILGKSVLPASFVCSVNDPYGVSEMQTSVKPFFDPRLAAIKNYGTEFNCELALEQPDIQEYAAIAEAEGKEIQPQVLKQLDGGQAVEGTVTEIFNVPGNKAIQSSVYQAIFNVFSLTKDREFLTNNYVKEPLGYLQEHWRMLDKAMMKVRVEKRAIGKYRVVIKGRPFGQAITQLLGLGANGKSLTKSMPLRSHGTAFMDGGFGRTGRGGFGEVKRMMLTTANNFRGGMKIQIIGTVIDIMGDAYSVYFDNNGSGDLSEFLGRAGVSIVKAGVTAAIGSFFAALATAGLSAMFVAGAPVILVVAAVVGGFMLAAYLVDNIDNHFNIKGTVAEWAK